MQIILLLEPHWPLVAHLTAVSAHHMAAALTNFSTPTGKVHGSNAHSITVDVNQPRRRQGEILVQEHFTSNFGLIFISHLFNLGLVY